MPLLIELIPIITFFIVYQWTDLYVATAIMMLISVLQIIVSWIQKKPITIERWASTLTLLVLGGSTLILRSTHFIRWKPTIGYGITAIMFAFSPYRHQITFPEKMLGNTLNLPKKTWDKVNNAWIIFFCSMGLLNLIVAYNTTLDNWIYFKFFGPFVFIPLFAVGQMVYLFYFKKPQARHEFFQR